MSENLNDNGVDEVVEDEVAAGAEEEVVESPEEVESQEPTTVPYARLSEVVQQREQMRLENERNAFKLQQLAAAYDAQQAELARLRPAPAQQTSNPWDTYTDPNAKALAQLVDQVVTHRQSGLQTQLQKLEALTDNYESTTFWSKYPKVSPEVQEAANRVYATARSQGMNIDRQTALVFARGEIEMAKDSANFSAAASSTTQQAQVNRTARAAVSTPGATPGTRPTTQPVKSASDILRQIEADLNKPRR